MGKREVLLSQRTVARQRLCDRVFQYVDAQAPRPVTYAMLVKKFKISYTTARGIMMTLWRDRAVKPTKTIPLAEGRGRPLVGYTSLSTKSRKKDLDAASKSA